MRATGRLHLGNYLGGAKGMLSLQNDPEYETLYMVADMHGITTPYKISDLRENRREMVLDYLAVGLDPEKSIIFEQSEVGLHGELAFYFSNVVTIARMQHLPTFKEKVKQYPSASTMALLNYPILMASDILIYKAGLVPVGIDQEPHLEVAREIARKMNETYGTNFPEPKRFKTAGEYVPSLTGEGKMSKSVEGSFINLTDGLETIKAKVSKVPTDIGRGTIKNIEKTKEFAAGRVYLTKDGTQSKGIDALLKFVELFEGENRRKEYDRQYISAGIKYSQLKAELSQAIYSDLKPVQEKRKEIEAKPKYIDKVLKEGAESARKIAKQTLEEVKEKMGLK